MVPKHSIQLQYVPWFVGILGTFSILHVPHITAHEQEFDGLWKV